MTDTKKPTPIDRPQDSDLPGHEGGRPTHDQQHPDAPAGSKGTTNVETMPPKPDAPKKEDE